MSTVLDRVLLSPYGLRLVRKFKEHPRNLWEEHKIHQTSSSSSQRITIILSGKLFNMKISDAKSRTYFVEEFDTILEKFDKILADKMTPSQKIGLLKQAAYTDKTTITG